MRRSFITQTLAVVCTTATLCLAAFAAHAAPPTIDLTVELRQIQAGQEDQDSPPAGSGGACATSGGFYQNYAALAGIDKIIPVDVYVPGCPPRPETVIDAILQLQDKIANSRHLILNDRF